MDCNSSILFFNANLWFAAEGETCRIEGCGYTIFERRNDGRVMSVIHSPHFDKHFFSTLQV